MTSPEWILIKASEIMSERGKATGMYEDSQTREVCAYGALTLAFSEGRKSDYSELVGCGGEHLHIARQAGVLLAKVINPEHYGVYDPFSIITAFNDDPATTAEDVTLALKRAAAHEELAAG